MEQHNAPLFVAELCECVLQKGALIGIQSALLRGNGVPFLLAERGMTFLAPQAHQAQIAADRQQPSHRRTGWTVLLRAVPHLYINILRDVLRVVRVFKVG